MSQAQTVPASPTAPLLALEESRQTTLLALTRVEESTLMQLSRLTLPEIRAIQTEIANVLPAGNLPAFVLSGLLKLKERTLNADQVSRDLGALLRGTSLIPQGVYSVLIAGPAAVLYAYQQLLRLSGKDVASAFPQGTWQFYLQFGLREDTARHANETVGFHRAITALGGAASADARASVDAPPADATQASARQVDATQAAAWVCAVMELLYQYDDLLAADWTERVLLRLTLDQAAQASLTERPPFASLIADWNKSRPYHCPLEDAAYLAHRNGMFQRFIQERTAALPAPSRDLIFKRYATRAADELPAFQEQMTLLASLDPDRYQEHKRPIPLWQARVGLIWQGHTYLLPACAQDELGAPFCFPSQPGALACPLHLSAGGDLCDPAQRPVSVDRSGRVSYRDSGRLLGRLRPPDPATVRGWLASILSSRNWGAPPKTDLALVAAPRSLQTSLRQTLPEATQAELAALRCAPVLINWDAADHRQPLAVIRQGRRGVGDHALTILRTGQSIVLDQSHIFFDGMWGLAVAEILSDSAAHWYRRLETERPVPQPAPPPLRLASSPAFEAQVSACPRLAEAAAESDRADVRSINQLCAWLRQRGVRLTVNDLLILYRFFHAAWYRPSPQVQPALDALRRSNSPEARAAGQAVEASLARQRETNPALLIPMDASNVSPKERLFPTTFRNPLTEILDRFNVADLALRAYASQPTPAAWAAFDSARRELLAYLKVFGELLDTLKAVTMRGESFNTATIRLLAHLPSSMQSLLDQIPQRIGFLNEIVKGNEVFSNVGRVASGTMLTRFISAKDDGQAKWLVWGFLTDAQGRLVVSLRDFRPHVVQLAALGEQRLADLLARDYVESYVMGLNAFAVRLGKLTSLQA